jgi:hypothetical protein
MTIEETRARYEKVLGKPVPANMKNNEEWMLTKITEKLNIELQDEVKDKLGVDLSKLPKEEQHQEAINKAKPPRSILDLQEQLQSEPKGIFYSGNWAIDTLENKVYQV